MNARRRTRVLAGLLAGCTGAATLALTQAPGAAAPSDRGDLDDLELKAVVQSEHDRDVGRHGASAGDRFFMTERLFEYDDGHRGDRVGRSSVECVVTWVKRNDNGRVVNGTTYCEGALMLEHGQITAAGGQGFRDDDDDFTVAVTGGTGAYQGASGEMRVETLNRHASKLTFDTDDDRGLDIG